MVMKITEMFYTLRNRVRQSGESVPNLVGFSGSSGMKIPLSTALHKFVTDLGHRFGITAASRSRSISPQIYAMLYLVPKKISER
jgi:hypothetical protein